MQENTASGVDRVANHEYISSRGRWAVSMAAVDEGRAEEGSSRATRAIDKVADPRTVDGQSAAVFADVFIHCLAEGQE